MMAAAWTVFRKELLDALRDRRTLLMVLISSVAIGPLVLVLISSLVSGLEKRAEAREVLVVGLEHAPTLHNYLLRQTFTVRPGFEDELVRGDRPLVEVVSSSSNQRAEAGVRRITTLLRGFGTEQATLRLVMRGVSPALLQPVEVEERDVADRTARAAQLATMVPFFVLMAVVYGALNAALDTTAGERERGSLEPLLMNPMPQSALVLGKWGAVAAVGMLIACLSCLSFLPGQWLMRSEALAAMFRYGWFEALAFIALLLPLAGALAAVLMAMAIRSKSFKEAQASTTIVVLAASLLPLVTVFNQEGTAPWHYWVPALSQTTLMGRVLKGEFIAPMDVAASVVTCVVLGAVALALVSRWLRGAALK
jgi:sodium transport system permease protein